MTWHTNDSALIKWRTLEFTQRLKCGLTKPVTLNVSFYWMCCLLINFKQGSRQSGASWPIAFKEQTAEEHTNYSAKTWDCSALPSGWLLFIFPPYLKWLCIKGCAKALDNTWTLFGVFPTTLAIAALGLFVVEVTVRCKEASFMSWWWRWYELSDNSAAKDQKVKV